MLRYLPLLLLAIIFFGFRGWAGEIAATTAIANDNSQKEDVRVTVSAIRGVNVDFLDIPQSVSVLTSEDLGQTVYTSLEDALHTLPNMGLAQASQPYTPSHRQNTSSNYFQEGFSIRGLGGPRVLVVVDGLRQTGHGIGYGGGNLSLYDTYALERIEVLRGPGSVMYGTDAFGGVVSIVTREPVHSEKLTFSGRSRISFDGARNMTRMGGYVNVGDKNFACIFGASGTIAQQPTAPKGTQTDGGDFESYGCWLKADYLLTPHARLRFIANTTQVEDADIADGVLGHGMHSTFYKMSIPMYSRSELGVEWWGSELSEKVDEAKCGLYWSGLKRHFYWDSPHLVSSPGNFFREERSVRKTDDVVNTVEYQSYLKLNFEPHTLLVGVDLGWDSAGLKEARTSQVYRYVQLKKYPNTDPLNPVGKITADEERTVVDAYQYRAGLYAQDTYIQGDWEFVVGGRFDAFYVQDELNTSTKKPCGGSGSMSALYHWNDETSLYATAATGFRSPDLGERFQDTMIVFMKPMQVYGNPDLHSERSYSCETGIKYQSGIFKVEGATFVNSIQQYIGQSAIDKYTFRYDNLGHVLLYGFEGQLSVYPLPQWQCYMGGGRTYTQASKKIALPGWVFHFGTHYRYDLTHCWVSFIKPEIRGIAATSSYDSLNEMRYPGFGAFDVQVTVGLKNTIFEDGVWIIGVKNIFDKAYYTPFFGNPGARTNPQAGRGLFTAIEIGF